MRERFPPVVILAGGKGTRLASVVSDVPKPMAPVAGRPFLEYVVRRLVRQGAADIVLSTGHMADVVERHFGDGRSFGAAISYAREDEPLGTGGAIRYAASRTTGDAVLVLNGDSFIAADCRQLAAAHAGRDALVTIALARLDDTGRYGRVELGESGRIVRFAEKQAGGAGLINAGVYVIARDAIDAMPGTRHSFETDVLPGLVGQGLCGVVCDGFFIDIGIPEDYAYLCDHPEVFEDGLR